MRKWHRKWHVYHSTSMNSPCGYFKAKSAAAAASEEPAEWIVECWFTSLTLCELFPQWFLVEAKSVNIYMQSLAATRDGEHLESCAALDSATFSLMVTVIGLCRRGWMWRRCMLWVYLIAENSELEETVHVLSCRLHLWFTSLSPTRLFFFHCLL